MAIDAEFIRQAAALPVRNGRVCLITSSSGKRWIIPKGLIEPDQTPGEAALQEAWEEAGLLGTLRPEPVGTFHYEKWCGACHVTVFLMQVTKAAQDWPESDLRQRSWVSLTTALERLEPMIGEVVAAALGKSLAATRL